MQPDGQFLLAQASVSYALSDRLPGNVTAGSGAIVTGAWCISANAICYLTTRTHYGTLIPEHNGLSYFNEDIGKLSVPVREFNLIACLLAYLEATWLKGR